MTQKEKTTRELLENEVHVKLDGYVLPKNDGGRVPHEEFHSKFVKFLEENGWGYTGFSVQTNCDGESIEDVEE
ncbi:hypothetical protein EQV77_14870 [Halobacillus fulvus]|nr:hypothetical protein EQV77_14870 [Halobacillus fulvus]